MTSPPPLFDRDTLVARRTRATRQGAELFLHEEAVFELNERLKDVNRAFTDIAVVTGFPAFWRTQFPKAVVIPDDDILALEVGAYDLVVHAMCLHQANDPVGQLVQCRRALKPDGLLLCVMLGGQTLHELRGALAEAEVSISGGLSPRINPMVDIRDAGSLLQRAGLSLPVADAETRTVSYGSTTSLMRDLRAMGESNAMTARARRPSHRAMFEKMATLYPKSEDRVVATFELIYLTAWAPDKSQPKPLRPGSATRRLADALKTTELGEDARPVKTRGTDEI
ncbi:MAG: methyltransferase domain-containing protein [Pseudomonadota bacterium]